MAILGANSSTLTVTNAATQNLGNYAVVVYNGSGSVTSAVVSLAITNQVCVEPPAGIMSWYPGQSNANDVINGHDGVLMNGEGFTNGFDGEGFAFDGGKGYVQLPENLFPLPNAQPFSIELWFATTNGGIIVGQQNGAPFNGVPNGWVPMLYVGTDGHLYAQLFWNGYFNQISTIAPVSDGWFHHLALTYDGNNETVYLDGAEVGGMPQAFSTYSGGFNCQIGTGYTAGWPAGLQGWFTFNGVIDEVTLYSNALNPAQLLALFDAGTAGKCTDQLLPVITLQPSNQNLLAGKSTSLAVAATGLSQIFYQWYDDAAVVTGATNPVLALPDVSTVNSGSYYAVVSNYYGSVTSAVVNLSVTNAQCVEPPPGLISWWPGQGNTLDIVGTNNGLFVNGANYGNGIVGEGFAFYGGASYVQLPENIFPPPNAEPFSIELWFETTNGGVLFEQQAGEPFSGVPGGWVPMLYVDMNGLLRAQLFWDGYFDQITSSASVNDGSFHHAAVTYDGNNQALYVDGVEVGSAPLPYSPDAATFNCQIGTGYTQGWPSAPSAWFTFNGIIDEVSLYSNALSGAQIQSIYNASSGGKCNASSPPPPPVIVAQPTNQTVSPGGTAVFSVSVSSTAPLNYQWMEDSNTLNGATNATYVITNVLLSASGDQFMCEVSNSGGTSNSAVAVLNVVVPAPPHFGTVTLEPQGIQMTVSGPTGQEFRILASTNLINWQTLVTLTNVTGTIQYTDFNASNFTSRYYQLTTP